MLVAHGAVEAALCRFVARRGEVDRAELLVDIVLADAGRTNSDTSGERHCSG
jgi:hypothetical protein